MQRFANVCLERNVPCTLRDGVVLYADVYRPSPEGEFPVLLMRQPYGRRIASTVSHAHPAWYAGHGYMVVIQDVRGRGDSEGEFVPFVHEAEDGYDAVEWAAKLPGSNGRVGMYGFSYQGSTQWAAASRHPEHLAAIAPSMCAADLYRGWMYPYGSFHAQSLLPWAYQLARDSARRAGDREAERLCTEAMGKPETLLKQLPYHEGHPLLERYCPAYFEWVNRPEYDEYWARLNWLDRFMERPIPAFHIGGWYDFLLDGTIQSYGRLQTLLQSQPRTRELFHRLEIGPWAHIPWGRKAGGLDHGPQASGEMHRKQLQWFDYWLKGWTDNGLFEEAPVRYYERGGGEWKELGEWPAAPADRTAASWLIGGSAVPANGALGGGRLATKAESVDKQALPDVAVYDARLPMPLESWQPTDRSAIQDRPEILVYTSDPVERDVHAVGSPNATVSCQALDGPTDLVAVLTLLHADGRAEFLSVGRTEIGGRRIGDAGEWETAEIRMRPFAACLPAGARLRLELTGSAFPALIRHPNGKPIREAAKAELDELQIATIAVRGEGRSVIRIPAT